MKLTQKRLKEMVYYDPDLGWFMRLIDGKKGRAGDIAGTLTVNGYVELSVLGIRYLAHRLAYFYMTGKWPDEIDHMFHDTTDNRFTYIRQISSQGNKQNRKQHQRNNKLGVLGVSMHKKRFVARIKSNSGETIRISCATLEEAKLARRELKLKYHRYGHHD